MNTISHPLTVIGLFLGLVEVCLAYVYGESTGPWKNAVLIYALAFTSIIAGLFFFFLWKKNWVFYPPVAFNNPTVGDFVTAMNTSRPTINATVINKIEEAFASGKTSAELDMGSQISDLQKEKVEKFVEAIRRRIIENVQHSIVYIDARPLKGKNGPQWEEIYDADRTVDDLLNSIWFGLQPFPPYAYGMGWLLRDASTGNVLECRGLQGSGRSMTKGAGPKRLAECGIQGGVTLEVISS